MAALMAPALSIAIAATGTPAGICTLESSASMPDSTVVAMGTAITGKVVSAATTPARCAAPPAATITTFSPLSMAVLAYSCVRAGERCAETTSISNGIENFASIFADSFITGRSVSEPMMMPTRGLSLESPLLNALLHHWEWPHSRRQSQSHLPAKFVHLQRLCTTHPCDPSTPSATPCESRPSEGRAHMGSLPQVSPCQSPAAARPRALPHLAPSWLCSPLQSLAGGQTQPVSPRR